MSLLALDPMADIGVPQLPVWNGEEIMSDLKCSLCGRPLPQGAIICAQSISHIYAMCAQCHALAGTCALCTSAQACPFETDTSCSLPKQVQQTIRQGQMVMQTVVKNPDRIRETCQKSCKCWSDELGCLKQNGTCGQYEEVIPDVKV